MNSLQFLPFKIEFFAFFTLQGWILCNFHLLRVISLQFFFGGFFWVKRTKNYFCNGEFFKILIFFLVIGVFLSGILRVCCFDTNHSFSVGWFVDIFYPSSVYFFTIFPFSDILGWKWTKLFLVMVIALKFWYLFKWLGYFRELKQQRFWATYVNRKWTFCSVGLWFGWNPWVNRLYRRKETQQYKFGSVQAYKKGESLTSGWRASLKNVFA